MRKNFYSISSKVKIHILFWLVGAIVFTGLSSNAVWNLQDNGEIINKSGSLRKNTFYLLALKNKKNNQEIFREINKSFNSIISELENRFDKKNFHLVKDIFFGDKNNINKQLAEIKKEYNIYYNNFNSSDPIIINNQINFAINLVEKINNLVSLVEHHNKKQVQRLYYLQILLIIMVIFSAFIAISWLNHIIINPLKLLGKGIEEISNNNFAVRIISKTKGMHDEFDEVRLGFNEMAIRFENLYLNLEKMVKAKTLELENNNLELANKNNELSTLYKGISFLNISQNTTDLVKGFLDFILSFTKANAISLRIINPKNNNLEYLGSINFPIELSHKEPILGLSTVNIRNNKLAKNYPLVFENRTNLYKKYFNEYIDFPVNYYRNQIGIIVLYFNKNIKVKEKDYNIIQILSNQFGIVIENNRLLSRDKELAIIEERNLMAQGLHDSIAQSLSFLNIQAQMLTNAIKNNKTKQMETNLNFIKDGIKECYDDVRELLQNFRTKFDDKDFKNRVNIVINNFIRQTNIPVELVFIHTGKELTNTQQLQIVFILQEALSNIRKHANATKVEIKINNKEFFQMIIKDNGIGFKLEEVNEQNHIGLLIMKERAQNIKGTISLISNENGTSVILFINEKDR